MIYDLFTNITILVSFLFIVGQVFKNYSLESDSPLKNRIVIGGIFGLMGIVLMIFTIKATDIVIIDLRNIAVICAGIFGGPIAVIISSLTVGLFRILYFGVNIASTAAFIVASIVGIVCAFISKSEYSRIIKFISMFLTAMIFSSLALLYLLSDTQALTSVLKYYWMIYTLGALLAYYACGYIILNNKIFRELSYYQIMADNLLDMITIHKPDGTYKYVSPSARPLLGKSPEELVGKSLFDLIDPKDMSKFIEIQTGIINNTFNEYTQDLRLKNISGQDVWVESTFKSIKDSDGNTIEIICATRDITERKKIEQQLKKQKEQAMEANRLKSQFLANMSHELRTPLNSIIGFTTMVLKKSKNELSEIQLENLSIVKEEGHHLLSLINDLLDYSKIEAGKMDVFIETFSLETVVSEALSTTAGLREEKDLKLDKIINCSVEMEMTSDRIKTKQILVNLLSNAFKYSEKGTVKLIVSKMDECFKIDVIDQGIGIEAVQLSRIFDEFHQVDGSFTRKAGGTGLGLAISKKLVQMLGGKIYVESTVDKGSCFTVYLPIDYNKRSAACNQIKPIDFKSEREKRVVFIEDDFSTRRLYNEYLIAEGFIPVSIDEDNGLIETIVEINPIAIILGIMLKNRDGWEILNQIKQSPETKDIPVIISSVLNEQKIAYSLNADEYLVKPVLQDELISAINRATVDRGKIEVLIADDDKNYLNLIGEYLKDEDISYITAENGNETIEMVKKYNPKLVILDLMMPFLTGFEVLDWIRKSDEYKNTVVIVVSSKDLSTEEKQTLEHSVSIVIQKSGTHVEEVMNDILTRRG